MKVIINNAARKVIDRDAQSAFPNECCGFLYGRDLGDRIITRAIPVLNVKDGDQRRRFEINPLDYMKAEKYALEQGIDFLGIYHSHPDHPAIASVHDLAKALPFFSYVIVSVMDGEIADHKSWRLYDEKRAFYEELVELENEIGLTHSNKF